MLKFIPKGFGSFDIHYDGYMIGSVAPIATGWGAQCMQIPDPNTGGAGYVGCSASTREAAALSLAELVGLK